MSSALQNRKSPSYMNTSYMVIQFNQLKNISFKNKENIHKKEGGWVIPLFWLFSDPIRSGKKS